MEQYLNFDGTWNIEEELTRLCRTNPIVGRAFECGRDMGWSKTHSLAVAVITLAKHNDDLLDAAKRLMASAPPESVAFSLLTSDSAGE